MFEITGVRLKRGCTKLHISYVNYVVLQEYLLNYSAQNESESRSRDRCFLFFVLSCVTYYGLFYCTIGFVLRHWRLIAPLELYCAIVSGYYLSFK